MSADLCRLCCKCDTKLLEVFASSSDEVSLATKVFCCFGVKIEEDDSITKKICKSCYFFTNSAYEYRVSAQQNDVKLKKECVKSEPKLDLRPKISYPPENITQDDFLNGFNLTHKNSVSQILKSQPGVHSSVQNLKRKYPEVIVPASCLRLNVNPIILLERTDGNISNALNLGVWSVQRKRHGGETGVVLSRVKDAKNDQNHENSENVTNLSQKKKKRKTLWCEPKRKKKIAALRKSAKRENEVNNTNEKKKPVPAQRSPIDNGTIRSRSKPSREWKPRPETRKSTRCSDKEKEKTIEVGKEKKSIEELVTSIDESVEGADDRNILSNLLKSDECLTRTMLELPDTHDDRDSISNFEQYNNSLVSVGEEMQTFICQTCNKIFDTLILLNRHKKSSHRSSLRCSKCSKKFAVVESLMRHTLAYHPEVQKVQTPSEIKVVLNLPITEEEQFVNNVIAQSVQPEKKVMILPESYKRVARKSTGGSCYINNMEAEDSKIEDNVEEYVISSDDESEIIEVSKVQDVTPVTFQNVLDTALQAQLQSKPNSSQSEDGSVSDDNLLVRALTPQQLTDIDASESSEVSNDCTPASVESVRETVPESDQQKEETEQVLVINDSDGDDDIVEFVPNEDNSISQVDDSALNSSAADNLNKQKQQIMLVKAPEEQQANSTVSTNAKITNEDNYINYIFNKCRYGDKVAANQQQWVLKGLMKYTENNYIPVDISHTSVNDVNAYYSFVCNMGKAPNVFGYWNFNRAIVPKKKILNNSATNNLLGKRTNYGDRIAILSTSDNGTKQNSSQLPTNATFDTSHVVQIGTAQQKVQQNIGFQNVIPQRNKQKTYQGKFVAAISNDVIVPQQYNFQRTSNQAVDVGSVEQINTSPYFEQKTVGQQYVRANYKNRISILNHKGMVSKQNTNQVNANQVVSTSPSGTVQQISTQSVIQQQNNPRTNCRINRSILPSNGNLQKQNISREMFYDIAGTSGIGSVKQISTTSQNGEQNNQQTNCRNKDSILNNSGNVFNRQSTNQIVQTNVGQQNTVQLNYNQSGTSNILNSYLSNETRAIPDQVTNVPANNGEQINLFYILGNASGQSEPNMTPTHVQQNNPSDLIQTTNSQSEPVILNGMSYPNFAKIRYGNITNSGQPVLMQQFVGQPTNVNIQNYVSINQSNISSSSTDIQEQVIQGPISVIPTSGESNVNTDPVYELPMQQNQSALSVEEPSIKPSIRIKTLSELTGKTVLSTEERNMMHGYYSNTVHTYFNNSSTNNSSSTAPDSYSQIS